jgi:predicted DNA binding protein
MQSLEVDVVQYDCPYIDTTVDHDVAFITKQWDLNTADEVLETRTLASGTTAGTLSRGLDALREHPNMERVELLRQKGDTAVVRSRMAQTKAMDAVRANRGYVTGPFEIRDGSERWRVGFETESVADAALAALDEHNDFTVESRESFELEDYYDVLENITLASKLFEQFRDLSDVERETVKTAVESGYFDRPREADLSTLAEKFDISETAASMNLRRSQRKILGSVVEAIEAVEAAEASPFER